MVRLGKANRALTVAQPYIQERAVGPNDCRYNAVKLSLMSGVDVDLRVGLSASTSHLHDRCTHPTLLRIALADFSRHHP